MRSTPSTLGIGRVFKQILHHMLLCTALVLMHTQALSAPPASASTCTTHPPLLDRAAMMRRPQVRRVSMSQDQHSATLLLSDARAIWVRSFGCVHAGMAVSTWLYALPPSVAERLRLAGQIARLGSGLPFQGVRWSTEDFVEVNDPARQGLAFHLPDRETELDINVNYQEQSDGTYVLQIVF